MAEPARIGPEEVHKKVEKGEVLLVCAYFDKEKCKTMHLEGSIFYDELESKLPSLPKDEEIVFYCA